jgi:hypothetical protein
MVRIQMTRGFVALVDEIDADLAAHNWFSSSCGNAVYAARMTVRDGRRGSLHMHRVIAERMGLDLRGKIVDHINGNSLDNGRSNLRLASKAVNSRNTRLPSTNTSGYKGVSFYRKTGKWRAYIKHNDKTYWLGMFVDKEDANRARLQKERELWGVEYQRREAHERS